MVLYSFNQGKWNMLYDPDMTLEIDEISIKLRYYRNFKSHLISSFKDDNILVLFWGFEDPLCYWILPDLEKLTEKAKENIKRYLPRIKDAAEYGIVKIYIDKDLEYLDSNRVKINNPKEIEVEELKRLI